KDFLFSVLVFQRQRLPVYHSNNLLNVRVGHCALRSKIPWIVSLPGSAHGLRKDMYFQCALAAVSSGHRRDAYERALLDVGKRALDRAGGLRAVGERPF